MPSIDIFNGDADGLCALTQLRNAEPRPDARIVTGVKRDISLVAKAGITAGDRVTVLDVSLDKNRQAVVAALEAGAEVFYCDHHFAGEIPKHDALTTLIETAPDVCTSLLINGHLGGLFAAWAVVGAFGDNLDASATNLAESIGLDPTQIDLATRLGRVLNYNGYGSSLEDLHFTPTALYERMAKFASPFDFIAEDAATFAQLERGYAEDMDKAAALQPTHATEHAAVFALPAEAWARRVSGVFSNQLATQNPDRAHAVLTDRGDSTWLVSVRAPLNNKTGADELCRRFPTGGGRAAAAGINELPADRVGDFVDQFGGFYAR